MAYLISPKIKVAPSTSRKKVVFAYEVNTRILSAIGAGLLGGAHGYLFAMIRHSQVPGVWAVGTALICAALCITFGRKFWFAAAILLSFVSLIAADAIILCLNDDDRP